MTRKYTILDCQETALNKKGRCLSSFYINSSTPLEWECCEKHTWYASLNKVKKGQWCQKCFDNSMKEILLNVLTYQIDL
uniref:Zinc-ribbon domain-containing protein n=1 Tax=viral metagenome TaxID=1070528 RepID=A0A6C0LLY0_9ZZZZ